MKVALKNGFLMIKEMNPVQLNTIKTWNRMKYNRKEKMMVGLADIELLTLFGQLTPLTPRLQAELKRQIELQNAVNAERLNEEPVPFIKMPIKAKPYKHQIRGFNMAMLVFGIVKPKGNDNGSRLQDK